MLVITRRFGQVLKIGDALVHVQRDRRSDKVRIVVDAPIETDVIRFELLERRRLEESQVRGPLVNCMEG